MKRFALLMFALLPLVAGADNHDPIAERQELMEGTRDALRPLIGMTRGQVEFDAAMVSGAGYPMGPLTLADLIGNDTMLAVAEAFMEEYQDPRYAAPPLLRRMVEAGLLGRKSGRGFYQYEA